MFTSFHSLGDIERKWATCLAIGLELHPCNFYFSVLLLKKRILQIAQHAITVFSFSGMEGSKCGEQKVLSGDGFTRCIFIGGMF